MKKFRLLTLFLALSMIFCFYGVAFAGGGGPEAVICPDNVEGLPSPDAGKFLRGNFMVARDKGACSADPLCVKVYSTHFTYQVMLKWGKQEHLYSWSSALGTGDLCGYTSDDIKQAFGLEPCTFQVQDDFGLSGTPVIADLEITQQDFCGINSADAMIRGEIVIRIVPDI